jgi:hypothetical protein
VPEQPLTTGQIVAKMVEIREERRIIAKRDGELIAEGKSFELELLIRLDEQGVDKVSAPAGTATISETILPQVVDWDAFYKYMVDNDALYLLQKRPAAAAFREMHESGQPIPGVEPFTQRTIGLRKK